ncbi:MAG: CoA protein activase, partial [Proteobacteria bacterium]|nr:CoA protein activase [Pseudomonadota bacterium]
LTGSAGMGISEKADIPFVQEIVATDRVIREFHPDVRTLLDIGGEDSKMIFFAKDKVPDIRMNGNCAGGTGAFIDQIATLLNISPLELNELAKKHTTIYPVASRCGVFAKTDVQNLLSRKIPGEDIAASIFHAVAIQSMNTLARGFDVTPKLMLCGGPFTFLSELSKIFLKAVDLNTGDLVVPDNPELLPALGAAFMEDGRPFTIDLRDLLSRLERAKNEPSTVSNRLEPLFQDEEEFATWKNQRLNIAIKEVPLEDYQGKIGFLGIDSGSTTTKITVTGENDELLFSWYRNNLGNSVDTVIDGLDAFRNEVAKCNPGLKIARTTVTGYGEDLVGAAFAMDKGVVETIAHFTAARHIDPDVSFVLDIGGQDMKAIFINNGIIDRIELNEACSSGCGSFLETFGNSLDYEVSEFARIACQAEAPCDLGTRCTVFMNSKVKQSLRENATTQEISAGLAYSVIKNCLFKVLKLNDMSELGDHIVLQGGTFKNPSIVRALEKLSEKKVRCSNIPELMGAYGASLIARLDYEKDESRPSSFVGLENLKAVNDYGTKQIYCKGCENTCVVTRFKFGNRKSFFSGNKCEKFFSSKGEQVEKGINLFEHKLKLLFEREKAPHENPILTVGIPRCLNIYENFPFWNTLFTSCGINVTLSSPSTMGLYEKGLGTIMSDSVCFPAKIAHGHIVDLAKRKVDRIFYPIVMKEKIEFENSMNSFNCPIVSSYAEVIVSSVNPEEKYGIPVDKLVITFSDDALLKKTCFRYLKQFGIDRLTANRALKKAFAAQKEFKRSLREKGADLIHKARETRQLLVVLAGRPYQADPLINHKTPEILTDLGVNVVTEDSIPQTESDALEDIHVITQWSYPNRIFMAAQWTAKQPDNIQFVQFNSFGCGPDALVTDETREILKTGRKNYTLIKIDEITSTGSVRLRLRSMMESLKLKEGETERDRPVRKNTPAFGIEDKGRTILAPYFADNYSPLIPALFEAAGYKVVNLPKSDRESVEIGLRYANHDICYPATIVIGDIIKALQTGRYRNDEIAVGITQTGGQCRASNYLSLIRKAIMSAGFRDIPVISVTTTAGLHDQPGFQVNWLKLVKWMFLGTIYADTLSKMYYATVVRETVKGTSKTLQEKYLQLAQVKIKSRDYPGILDLLESAIDDFNQVEIHAGDYPKIGIVGEIYIKYNSFGHQRIVDWLIDNGIEAVVPPVLDFFTQGFINNRVNKKLNLNKTRFSDLLVNLLERYTNKYQNKINKTLSKFRFYSPFHDLKDVSKKANR